MISYTPLSLEQLCITKILSLVWHNDFDSIQGICFLLHNSMWNEKFRKRHEIMKWCMTIENNKIF